MMAGLLRRFLGRYLAPNPSREIRELYASRVILDFAVAMVAIFEPIYLYRLGFSVVQILGVYLAVYIVFFFLVPIGGKIGRAFGYEHGMTAGIPFLIAYYLSLFAVVWDWRFVILAAILSACYKALYWTSYHANFAAWGHRFENGREVSNMIALVSFFAAFAPALGGLMVALGGWTALFSVVIVLLAASSIPMLITPETPPGRGFPYRPAFRRLFRTKDRPSFLSRLGFGEELVALVIWPVFIALKVPDLLSLGAIISLAMVVKVIVTLYTGGLVDEGAGRQVLRSGVVFTAGSWAIRPLLGGGFGIFLFDSFYGVSKNMAMVPFISMNYREAVSGLSETDHIVAFQMAIGLGKALACLIGMLIFWLFPDGWWLAFLMAAGFSVLYSLARDGSS